MKKTFTILLLTLSVLTSFAQVSSGLLTTLTAVAGMRERLPVEKLYLQLDKPYYALGDTLHFKAYLLNADFLKPSLKSGLLYVELDDNTGKCLKRILVPALSGLSWGDMALDEKLFPEGSYTLRAYTNWMLNFGDDYVFKQNINISALSGSTLVKATFKADKDKILANLRFTGLDKIPFRLKDMQLWVMNGKHNLFKNKASTGMDGSMDVNFDLANNIQVKDLSIHAQEIRKGTDEAPVLIIPVTLNRPENTDLQFMPEGGNMVGGISTRIGFKAISEDGKAAIINGKIYNSKQQEVGVFKSSHKGMGSFELLPEAGESYAARVTFPGNISKSYPLPAVNPKGTTLRISPKGKDSLEITIKATPDLFNTTCYLIAQTRGLICYTTQIGFKGPQVKKIIARDLFPTGLAHFTLFNNSNQPLNERIVYVGHNDNMQISITAGKPNYAIRDSIALTITVKDKNGKPVRGNFSLAVTDNSQVKTDSTNNNIISNLLVTSDLKGTIEEPGWYFENNAPDHAAALDNLLLIQGWVGYDWKAIFNPVAKLPQYPAEAEYLVEGKVTNVLNKPVEKSNVLLFAKRSGLLKQAMTDKDGRFIFRGQFPVDTAEFKIQARNKSGESFNVGIEMNEFKPPIFMEAASITPWYVNSDTISLSNSRTKAAQLQALANLRGEGHMLKQVEIKDKKIVKESHNLNGPGEADQVFDEQDMLKAGKMSLGDLLKEKIKGFNIGEFPYVELHKDKELDESLSKVKRRISYRINEKEMRLVIDGTDVDEIDDYAKGIVPNGRLEFIKGYLDYFSAEDIKGIEVMFNPRYNNKYGIDFLGTGMTGFDRDYPMNKDWSFIEITTRSGKGPWMKLTPGTYLYKPLPYTLPKDFYRPRYTIKNSTAAIGTDLRSTIHWEPRVVTDKDGKATVTFYSADKPADYTVIMEGTDMNGNLGYSRSKIKVDKK